jgi:hypothetical protein
MYKFHPAARFEESTTPHTLLNPEILTIEKELGRGGFGAVYKVSDPSGQTYALKILLRADPDILINEVKTLAEISASPNCNPNMVCYVDTFILDWEGLPTYGILTEFIDGVDLDKCIAMRGYQMTPGEVMTIAIWLAPLLESLHLAGYVHRDLKPGNIMIQKGGKLKLIDFGISCFVGQGRLASCGDDTSGTPGFLAPEISDFRFLSDPDKYYKSADIFAFGVTLYNLLTGQNPYNLVGNDQIGYTPVPPYQDLVTDYPCLNQLIKESVDLNPDKRPTATQVVDYLEKCYRPDQAQTPACMQR